MKILKIYLILFVVLGSLFSCDFELEKTNPNNISYTAFYQNEGDMNKALAATYAVLQGHMLMGREWFFLHDMRCDDMLSGGGHLEAHRARLLNGTHLPSNGVLTQVWIGYYGMIFRANNIIARGPEVDMDVDLRDRMVAEAKFLRAFAYTELVSEWGGVPLITIASESANDAYPRATAAEVYDLIQQDLTEAIPDLPLEYGDADKARATRGAARAILARAYMQEGDYASAKAQLQAIVDSDVYDLMDQYNDNFLEETEFNAESVFEVAYMDDNNNTGWGAALGDGRNNETGLRNQEYCAVAWRNAQPSQSILDEYELDGDYTGLTKDDPRLDYTVYFIGETYNNGNSVLSINDVRDGPKQTWEGAETLISWQKWSLMYKKSLEESNYNPAGLNIRVVRYAEVLLNLAECMLETGDPIADVLDVMNETRDRADVKMPLFPNEAYPCTNYAETFEALVHERRVEFACECIRDLDIVRWRKHGKLSYEPLSYFQANKHELLPIPETEVLNNPLINAADQNPGY